MRGRERGGRLLAGWPAGQFVRGVCIREVGMAERLLLLLSGAPAAATPSTARAAPSTAIGVAAPPAAPSAPLCSR